MPYTDPGAVTTGTTITSTWGNAVRNAEQYLANPPACRVYHSANQSLTNNVLATLAFNSERWDTDTMHDTVTNNSRITFKTAGLYVVSASVVFTADNDYTAIFAGIALGGSTYIAQHIIGTDTDTGFSPAITLTTLYKFAVNDYVVCNVIQKNTSAAANNALASGNASPEFSAVWVGLG